MAVRDHEAVAVGQAGLAGLWRRCRPHNATAISAMPIGAPGWPELACCTASIASARIAFAINVVRAPVDAGAEEAMAAMRVPERSEPAILRAAFGAGPDRIIARCVDCN